MSSPTTHGLESSKSVESPQLCRQFTLSEIQVATKNFGESLVIGRGGFGKVYKGNVTYGTTLMTAAIKRLDSTSNQGALEFWAEVKMLSNLRHCHLVSLIGYCNDGQEMILVYEYMPHGTLEDHLHKRVTSLTWMRRLQICIGAARGLDYLHTGTGIKHGVIHRDVKPSNILLDDSWAAKISDFGLSKIGPINQPCTYVNTVVKGTFGYLDPDYFSMGRLTRKSDVFAFGVILFEVLCGRKAIDKSLDEEQWGLVRWVQDSIEEGRLKQIVDSNIRGRISPKCLKEFAQLAERCLHSHPKHRPTMAQVVVGLEYILALQEKANSALKPAGRTIFGKKIPVFVFTSSGENSDGSISLKSLRYHLDTILGENHIFRRFDFDTIQVATENFSEANRVFQLRFNSMYKGRLQNGQDIAIAESFSNRFIENHMREASILVKCEHENLVKMLGYCFEGTKVFFIYEFATNASLHHLLHDPMCIQLEWNKLYRIILGVARGLVYLHKHAPIPIIHGNVRPGNILLDESFDPKLSDLRFATAVNETDCVHVNAVSGTLGYGAPEHLIYGVLSTKADVYSLGVLILDTMTGLDQRSYAFRSTEYPSLLEYVQRNWLEGTLSNTIDPRMDVDSNSITRFLEIGLLCVQQDSADRPTMEEVVAMLLGSSSLTLPVSKMRAMVTRERSSSSNAPVDDYDTSAVEEFISDLSPR
ncbi:putative protein kinase RLK-Pelle-CrRLK1L-1 family [Helianthus annuus]|nr:putative protein kinase RLK-Pelle-CrRLK1L-1 family [Helianthus annuus]KAJ0491911.1 putative protein kinase RLK-Pelle-CrRLK1L-1 family [Helianthus annuus]